MYDWDIVEGRDHPTPLWILECETIPNMKTVVIMLQITRMICRTGKEVIMDNRFCDLKGFLEMNNRGVCGSALVKRGAIFLRGFMEIVLTIVSGKTYW